MDLSVEGLQYYENYRCWEGKVTVKCSKELFGEDEIALLATIKSMNPITEAESNAFTFLKTNFIFMYDQLLKGFCERFMNGRDSIEIFNEDTLNFREVEIHGHQDLHPYIGTPVIEVRHDCSKENFAYIGIYFFNDCLLSIEHGLSALFYKNDLIAIDPTDTDTLVMQLSLN